MPEVYPREGISLEELSQTLPDVTCYTGSLEVYFPYAHEKGIEALNKIIRAAENLFGGVTVTYGAGSFCQREYQNMTTGEKLVEPFGNTPEEEKARETIKQWIEEGKTLATCVPGTLDREPTAIISVAHPHCISKYEAEELFDAIREAGKMTNQVAVAFRSGSVFAVAPPSKVVLPSGYTK